MLRTQVAIALTASVSKLTTVSPQTLAQKALVKSIGAPFEMTMSIGSLTMKRWKSENAHVTMTSCQLALGPTASVEKSSQP